MFISLLQTFKEWPRHEKSRAIAMGRVSLTRTFVLQGICLKAAICVTLRFFIFSRASPRLCVVCHLFLEDSYPSSACWQFWLPKQGSCSENPSGFSLLDAKSLENAKTCTERAEWLTFSQSFAYFCQKVWFCLQVWLLSGVSGQKAGFLWKFWFIEEFWAKKSNFSKILKFWGVLS